MRRPITSALVSVLLTAACGGSDNDQSQAAGPLVEVREMIDDTLVVRVLSGSTWGPDALLVPELEIGVLDGDEDYMFGQLRSLAVAPDGTIYALDAQIPALRVYGPDGLHRGTWGRQGGGPGEFAQPDGGLAVLSDGRVAVRDPGNSRMQIYAPDGTPLETWPVIPGGFNTSRQMHLGRGDTLLTPLIVDLTVDIRDWRTGLQRVSPEGAVVDTVALPEADYQVPMLEARVEQSVSRTGVPFAPSEQVAWHPDGFFVHGIGDHYSFTLLDPDAPMRIEREVELPEVTAAERAEAVARTTRNLRGTDPNWRWSGPQIPERKAAFDGLYSASDGRIWVFRQGPGVELDDPDYDPDDPDSVENRWHDTPMWDVFERDGTFLGTAEAPLGMSRYPSPVFRGDRVWAVSRDEFDVQRIVRYRIVPRSEVEGVTR
jgi:hypothetical protein